MVSPSPSVPERRGASSISLATLISNLRQISEAGHPSEQRVARVILDDCDFATRSSVGEIARRANVSEATVTRTCHRTGCSGIKELKLLLAGALYSGVPYLAQLVSSEDDLHAVKRKVITGFANAIEAVDRALDPAVMESAVSAICQADKVIFIGSGPGSSTVVGDAPMRFTRIGINSEGHSEAHAQRIAVAALGEPAVIIAISNLGRVDDVVETIRYARANGHVTIAITSPQSQLALTADICIAVPVVEDPYLYFPSFSRLPPLMILDVISTAAGLRLGDRAASVAAKVKRALEGQN